MWAQAYATLRMTTLEPSTHTNMRQAPDGSGNCDGWEEVLLKHFHRFCAEVAELLTQGFSLPAASYQVLDTFLRQAELAADNFPAETGSARRPNQATLTKRQREVLTLIARGLNHKQVAQRLHIKVGTVEVHLKACYQRLGVSCALAAVDEAHRRGLIA